MRSKPTPRQDKRGGEPFKPLEADREIVTRLAGYGFTEAEISTFIKNPKTGARISVPTLIKHFREELDTGHLLAASQVAAVLFKSATGTPARFDSDGNEIEKAVAPNVVSAMFWAKTRMQWRETSPVSAVEFKKGAGGAMNVTVTNYAG